MVVVAAVVVVVGSFTVICQSLSVADSDAGVVAVAAAHVPATCRLYLRDGSATLR